jgi:subtilisin-like proprotein convertase family protein
MKRSWLTKLNDDCRAHFFLILILLSGHTQAQTFTNSAGGRIPANGNSTYFYLPISSLGAAQLDSNYGLLKVCIDISHPRVSSIGVSLAAPDGTQIDLADGVGGSGANFSGTCFSMSDSVTVFSGFAPFTGGYYPRHNIGEMNDGQTGIGTWMLVVQNLVQGDSGRVNSWSMTFGTHAPVPISTPFGPCNQFNANGCACADSTQNNCWLVPDMIVGKEWFTDTIHRREFHDSIRVSNSVGNIGYGPMEFYGTGLWFCGDSQVVGSLRCPDSTLSKETIRQRIYQKNQNGFFTYKDTAAGTMDYHPELGHNHMHIDDWTENTLRIRGPESDPTQWPIIGRGKKTSMNVYDEIRCDNIFTACDYGSTVYSIWGLRNAGLGLGYSSGNAYIQGISVGFADIYEYLIPFGQTIYFDSICNGDYVLMGQFDPDGRFVDMDRGNNVTWFTTTLTKQTPACCQTKFDIDTVNYSAGLFHFIDRSVAMPAQWYWTFGDGDTSTEQFPFHQYTIGGAHTVTLTTLSAQGCGGRDTFTVMVPQNVGIVPVSADIVISVFPNPSAGSFKLSCDGDMTHDVRLSLYNVLGQSVDFTYHTVSSSAASRPLELSVPEPGTYILRVQTAGKTYYRKLLKL